MVNAEKLVKIAEEHIGEKYVFGSRVPMSNPRWSGPWDCAEFVSWCVFQAMGKLFGCRPMDNAFSDAADAYTGYWAVDSKSGNARIGLDVAAGTRGAILLREPPGGNIPGHIVISLGDGGTIEAMNSKKGVCYGKVSGRRWDYGILVPGIQIEPSIPITLVAPKVVFRISDPRMSGPAVRCIQRALKNLGYSPGPIDGSYGYQTASAVEAFQVARKIVPDGEVGVITARALGVDI